MGQYQLLSILSAQLSPLNIDHSRNLPVENLWHQLHRKVYKPLNKLLITNLFLSCHYSISYQKKIYCFIFTMI